MKTHLLLASGILSLSATALAQETIVTSAPTIEAAINTSSADLSAKLNQLLEQAQQQNEKLQTSLDRMGDPASANLASVQMIKNDIIESANVLKTQDEQRAQMTALTGAEVFDDDAFGLMEAIGATVTRKDGTVVDRDAEKYRLESAMMEQVKEFKEVRKKALDRKKTLTDELANVMQDLEAAQDLATIHKLNGMITLLRGQIDECNQTILIAQADADMMQKELVGQAQIVQKGKQEANVLEDQTGTPGTAPSTTFGSAGAFGGVENGAAARPLIPKLPWGRKAPE